MPFFFKPLDIPEVILVTPERFGDNRGFFMETYHREQFAAHGIDGQFVQDNHSRSSHGVLRGLHYQNNPAAQGKLLRVVQGEVFDAAVDIRANSPTFGKWVGEILSADNGRMLYVPPGFAHGFCVLSESADLLYKVTTTYSKDHERGIAWNDPTISIDWPIQNPILSERDTHNPSLAEADHNFVYQFTFSLSQ
jgi:dTDP-4-dehydrorhamnose 3,5-epimerase